MSNIKGEVTCSTDPSPGLNFFFRNQKSVYVVDIFGEVYLVSIEQWL